MYKSSGTVFILCNKLNITCGVSSHLYYLLMEMGEFAQKNIILISGGGNANSRYEQLVNKLIIEPTIQHETRSLPGFFKAVTKVRRLMKEFNPTVIHSHHFYAANISAYARIGKGISTIQTIHGNIPLVGTLPHYCSDYFILVSSHMIAQFKTENKQSDAGYSVIPSPFPFPQSPAKLAVRYPVRFLFAGRLAPEKRVDLFVEAAKSITKTDDRAEFYIAGDGPKRDYVVSAIEKSRIHFLGEIENLAEKLANYDVIVNCTNAKEGFPTIIIQAAASGRCVISSRFSGYSDYLSEKNSLLFVVNDQLALERIMRGIINEPDSLPEKGANLFQSLREVFRSDRISEEIVNLYKRALN